MDGQKDKVQFLEGTLEEYNNTTKDPKAFYCTTDGEGKKELHFGEDKLIKEKDLEVYQTKEATDLNTEDKTIVGAINELHAREDKEGLNEEQVKEIISAETEKYLTKEDAEENFAPNLIKDNPKNGVVQAVVMTAKQGPDPRRYGVYTISTSTAGVISERIAQYFGADSGAEGTALGNGRILQHDPVQSLQVANKRYVDAVGDRVSLLEEQNQMMSQVIQPVEDTYLSKSFTQKTSIFDNYGIGGKSKLLSIEGNTEVCKNLLNPMTIKASGTGLVQIIDNGEVVKVTVGNTNDTIFFYSLGILPAGSYTFSCGGVSTNKVPSSPSEKYSVITYINNGPDRQYIMPQTSIYPTQYTFQANGVNIIEVAFKRCTTDKDETITITRPQLEKNNYKTDFVPYYEGLKSPIITGIQSKSIFKNSGQIVNNYFNSTYECGAGVILDFENKKIINKFVEIEFDGSDDENWNFSTDPDGNGNVSLTINITPYIDNKYAFGKIYLSWINRWQDLGGELWTQPNNDCVHIEGMGLQNFSSEAQWRNFLSTEKTNRNPLVLRYVTRDVQSEEPLNENDIITTFNQCTQKPIYSADQDIVSKIPLKIKQEVVLTNRRESTTPLRPLTPAATAANLIAASGGDYGLYTYIFSGRGDFVYNEPIVLDYNEKLVVEFAINPTSGNYLTEDGWLAIALGNVPPADKQSDPQENFNMIKYSSMRQVIWGDTSVNGKTSFKTGLGEIYPNEKGNSNLASYYYKIEVTRVESRLYNYRLSRLRAGVENSYEIIDEIQDIKTDGNSTGIPSYYAQSIMIAGLGHKLILGGLRFYKAQL